VSQDELTRLLQHIHTRVSITVGSPTMLSALSCMELISPRVYRIVVILVLLPQYIKEKAFTFLLNVMENIA